MKRIEIPSEFKGTPEQQIKQVHSYLFRLAEILNITLDALDKIGAVGGDVLQISGSDGGASNVAVNKIKTELSEQIKNISQRIKDLEDGPIYPISV